MDTKKLNVPTLEGRNWGEYAPKIHAAFQLFDCWDIVKGEILTPPPNPTYDLLVKPTAPPANMSAADQTTYQAAKGVWNKKNRQALGLMQTTVSAVIWQNYETQGVAKDVYNALETAYGQAGGASTYLQLVNMVKIQFTNSTDLLSQIPQFQDNYNWITLNGHSKLSEDLTTFMFCLSLPDSYELTARQYLDNITAIANYKLLDIIAGVLQEESRRKAQALGHGLSLNKFSTVKNISQKCAKCGKTNHTTQNHWPGGKHLQKGKGQKSQKSSGSSGKKKADKKGKEKAQMNANVLDITDISEL